MDLKDHIRGIPDFPKPGILFYDVSTLLLHADAWQVAMGRLASMVRAWQPDLLAGVESRGFLLAAPLALKLGCGFVMLRKPGKLPGQVIGHDYALEYGTDRLEIQADAIRPGQRVVVVDDLLATGGTAKAAAELVRKQGGYVVGYAFVLELAFLRGREKLLPVRVESVITY
jgi:adenine phosphoribosyltransferase